MRKIAPPKIQKEFRPHSFPRPLSAGGIQTRNPAEFQKQISLGFAKSISPENSFRKTESELKPRHTARILGGQNPKKKNVLSILEKIHPRENQKSKRHFSFWGCRVERGGGGAFSERTI